MVLIIAEKPSLGRNIAAGIESIAGNAPMKKQSGYLEGNGYLVSWAFGHLFSLCDVEKYSPNPDGGEEWTYKNLPCFPKHFEFELKKGKDKSDTGVERQFRVLTALCNRPDVESIVNAGDADREGEIIVRLCLKHALKTKKPLYRLWLPDQTPETVKKALSEMKEETAYNNLAYEGFARTYIDWLYGVNLTRYATLRAGTLLRVGRVIVPIVRAIYERDMAIAAFRPEKYFSPTSKETTNGEIVELVSKTRFAAGEREKADAFCREYNDTPAVVTDVKTKKDTLFEGKLYSLSKLQNVLSKKYKMSMSDSLETVQKLYEAGYLTYPRTDSEYLTNAEKDKVRGVLSKVAALGYPVRFKDKKSIFDDKKVESHSALTPTYKIPDVKSLSERERQVYSTVFRRFVAVFCAEDCIVSKSEITIAVGDKETFTLKGTVILEPGWTKYDDCSQKDKMLPNLQIGDTVNIRFLPVEKETTPPRHYTVETLNNYLKNPFKEEKAKKPDEESFDALDDAEEYRAMFEGVELGTEATRTGIIDNARKSRYIDLKKDTYLLLPAGKNLIESLTAMNISMDKYKTCELGRALKKVYRGEMSIGESVALAEAEIAEVFRKAPLSDTGKTGDSVGVCPICGKTVVRNRFRYACENRDCGFSLGTNLCGREIPCGAVVDLLKSGKTQKMSGFVSKKSGKTFSARLKIEDGKVVFDF